MVWSKPRPLSFFSFLEVNEVHSRIQNLQNIQLSEFCMWIIVIGGRASSWMSTMAKRFRWRGLRFLGSTKLVPVVPSTKQLCRALLWKLLYAYMHVWLGTTVFHGTQNFEPSCGICQLPRNFYIFAKFCRIWYWPVIRGQIYGTFWSFSGGHTVCIRDFAMKYMTADWAVTEINVETIDLSLSEIFQVYLVDNCISQLQLLATNTEYLFGFRGW